MKLYESLTDKQKEFFLESPVFFVASAPLSGNGRVNVSPKGLSGTVKFLDLETVKKLGITPQKDSKCFIAYLDVGGSGIETYSHMKEPGNARITFMACKWQGTPNILRFYGKGYGFEPQDGEKFTLLQNLFEQEIVQKYSYKLNGQLCVRNFIVADITRIADSCGWAVPLMKFEAHRTQFEEVFQARSVEKWEERRKECNTRSIDGLTGLLRLNKQTQQKSVWAMQDMYMGLVFVFGVLLGVFLTKVAYLY